MITQKVKNRGTAMPRMPCEKVNFSANTLPDVVVQSVAAPWILVYGEWMVVKVVLVCLKGFETVFLRLIRMRSAI